MTLDELVSRTRCLLLDFDGPVCSVFAGYPAADVAEELRALIGERLGELPPALAELTSDPLLIVRRVADLGDVELTRAVADACRDAETAAVETATPTPGADDVLAAAHDTGRRVVIVSNNATEAVESYLRRHGLTRYVTGVAARSSGMDPRLLKPHPALVLSGLALAEAEPRGALFVGDSPSDAEAGRLAGTPTVGYANKPGKHDRLNTAGADVVIDSMHELAEAIWVVPAEFLA